MKRKYSAYILAAACFVAGIFFATSSASFFGRGDLVGERSDAASISEIPASAAPVLNAPSSNNFSDSFIAVAETINPMVVQIHSERVVAVQNPLSGSPFEQFFRQPQGDGSPQRSSALGSGVVIRPDGYILTNNHVIEGSEDLTVTFLDGRELDAEVIGADKASDLAIIHVNETDLPALSIDDAATVRVGEWVLAFGSPLSEDLGNTVTSGIVSAVHRTSLRLSTLNLYASFIQTDAAINPGNSGGPLVNLSGQLVGINSAIYSQSGGNQGIGFTIPSEVVKNVATQLIDNGSVSRGGLGILFGPVSRSLAEVLNVSEGSAQVTEVVPNSAAEEAGMEVGDIITAIDGKQLRNYNELRTTVGNRLPGDRLEFKIVRDSETRNVEIVLGNLSTYSAISSDAAEKQDAPSAKMESEELGFSVSALTDQVRQQLNLSEGDIDGVIVMHLDKGSSAFRDADLQQGDIIMSVDGKKVTTPKEFMKAYGNVNRGKSFLIQVARVGRTQVQRFYTALSKPE